MKRKKNDEKRECCDCRNQMSGFDGGFFGLPLTCECAIYGEVENREECKDFERRITKKCLMDKIRMLESEIEMLKSDR